MPVKAIFAVPGDLGTPTGGYAYARRLLGGMREGPDVLEHLALPGGFPDPDAAALAQTSEILAGVGAGRVLLIDGLAYGALPKEVISRVRAPIVALCHHPLALETGLSAERAATLRQTERAALAAARHVVATSNATAGILLTEYAVDPHALTVAPPGTDPAERAGGSGSTDCAILSVGSISERKGRDLLIETLAELAHLNWTLRIVGPVHDTALAARLERRIAEAGLAGRIDLTGPLPPSALEDAYRTADLFVLTSRYEGFGMAFTEAMAHGLATLGLELPAVEEATAGMACLVAPKDLGGNLRLLISDRGTRETLANRCWTAAQTFLRWPQTVNIVSAVLREAAR